MKLTMVYDNEVPEDEKDLIPEWGFSCLVETGGDVILFDTGGDGRILLHNMEALGVDPDSINRVVISHEHWDHAGGLGSLLEVATISTVYRTSADPSLKGTKQIIISDQGRITDNVFTTGTLTNSAVPEQSLYLKGRDGWYVLAGCSHPGVGRILAAGEGRKIRGLIGGFHGFSELSMLKDLSLICPAHCTRKKKEILRRYPVSALVAGVGRVIEI